MPSQPSKMAKVVGEMHGVSFRLAFEYLRINEICYRYEVKLDFEDQPISDWMPRLTEAHGKWGFGCATCICGT